MGLGSQLWNLKSKDKYPTDRTHNTIRALPPALTRALPPDVSGKLDLDWSSSSTLRQRFRMLQDASVASTLSSLAPPALETLSPQPKVFWSTVNPSQPNRTTSDLSPEPMPDSECRFTQSFSGRNFNSPV